MRNQRQRGFSLPIVAIIIGLVLALSYVLFDVTVLTSRTSISLTGTLSAQQIAEAGLVKATYCMNATSGTNCGGTFGTTYVGETDVAYGNGTYTSSITGAVENRDIVVTGRSATGQHFTVAAQMTSLPPTDEIALAYALQAGGGGVYLKNNASISGTIYALGNVSCQSSNASITGDAYIAKTGGIINACTIGYDAHADNITSSKIGGDAYYNGSISGTTVSGTKFAGSTTPPVVEMPSVDIEGWHLSATNGGTYTGDYHPADNSTLGPIKIDGDLYLDNNVDVTVTGGIWVKGNVYTGNNSSFRIDPSFGEYGTVILADDPDDPTQGIINITNNTGIYGSGQPTSHLMFASTSTANTDALPAILVSNNAVGAVFYATNGTLRLNNNAGAKSLSAYRLSVNQNAIVNYVESEMSGQFSNSPGGIWRIIDGTWREVK